MILYATRVGEGARKGGLADASISDKYIVNAQVSETAQSFEESFGHAARRGGVFSLKCKVRLATAIHKCGQAIKGAWWMPRRAKAMKDVAGCDMPRGAAKQALIRGFPNGETHPKSCSGNCR